MCPSERNYLYSGNYTIIGLFISRGDVPGKDACPQSCRLVRTDLGPGSPTSKPYEIPALTGNLRQCHVSRVRKGGAVSTHSTEASSVCWNTALLISLKTNRQTNKEQACSESSWEVALVSAASSQRKASISHEQTQRWDCRSSGNKVRRRRPSAWLLIQTHPPGSLSEYHSRTAGVFLDHTGAWLLGHRRPMTIS